MILPFSLHACSKLREHGVAKKVTVQTICRVCRDEKQVREFLDFAWNEPAKVEEHLSRLSTKNETPVEFEKMLES